MANFPVQITATCTLNPQQVPPPGVTTKCQLNSTVTYNNSNAGEVILSFVTASGSPFKESPPYKIPGLGSPGNPQTYTIGVNPTLQTSYPYSLSCNAAAAGIIIVDGSGGEGKTPPRPGTAKKAGKKKTKSGTRGKSKAKAKPKRGGGGTRKKSKGKTKKTARRKRK